MVYYKIPLSGGLNYPAGCILVCAYTYNGYEYCKFEKVTEVGSNWVSISESEFNVRCPDFPEPEYAGEMESDEYPGCYYRMVNGEKEWRNPPMVDGQDYRTSERCDGKAVYVTGIKFSGLPTTAEEDVYKLTNIPASARIVGIYGTYNIGDQNTLPITATHTTGDYAFICATEISESGSLSTRYYVKLTTLRSYEQAVNLYASVTVKYVKS